MPPFPSIYHQNKCYEVFKYEKINYSHRILNIQKKNFKNIFIFCCVNYFWEKRSWCGRKKWCARRREPRVLIFLALNILWQFHIWLIWYLNIYPVIIYRVISHTITNYNGFIECFTTTFLHTIFSLNWVDEDDWWGWGWLERKANTLDTSKRDPKHCAGSVGDPGLYSQLYAIIWNY